jgi:hypothetical protein
MTKSNIIVLTLISFCILVIISIYLFIQPVKVFSQIDTNHYKSITQYSTEDITTLIKKIQTSPQKNKGVNQLIQMIQAHWKNKPYALQHALGEGNWCSDNINLHTCRHIQQDPVFRTDEFNCTTYVQNTLALINSRNINQFKHTLVSIAYGAEDNSERISYFNRNHFTSSDFNRINEARGLLKPVHFNNIKTKNINVTINHTSWFQHKAQNLKLTVRVLNAKDGLDMAKLLRKKADGMTEPPQNITVNYIPKQQLVIKTGDTYQPNLSIIEKLPTPSILEIVRDDSTWDINNENIKSIIHSGIAISHLGLLYRQHFNNHALIYQKITCQLNNDKKVCIVTPERCKQKHGCNEVMYSQATDAFPNHYVFYKDKNNHYHCTATLPKNYSNTSTTCNRVESLPLANYILRNNYNAYTFMENPSFIGIHLEKITAPAASNQVISAK